MSRKQAVIGSEREFFSDCPIARVIADNAIPVIVVRKVRKDYGLKVVAFGKFRVIYVDRAAKICDFVRDKGLVFQPGNGFYEFTKPELIQEQKEVIVLDNVTNRLFTGVAARKLIGLPFGQRARVRPLDLPGYTVFVQSTSWNRKLITGTRFLYRA